HARRRRAPAPKARTRQLIEAGGLLDKAGLLGLDGATLYGALLAVAAEAGKEGRAEEWRKVGGQAFEREAKARDAGREPLVLTLPAPATAPVQAQLRKAGFRWSVVMRHWEGLAAHDAAQALAAQHGGGVRRVGGPEAEAGAVAADADLSAAAE
ncbi:MAG: conjugal transfer protein TraD, partial [Methylobacterium organophilum]|nr:conjugal transfer protein TraD [Methylobacterium organophilum]